MLSLSHPDLSCIQHPSDNIIDNIQIEPCNKYYFFQSEESTEFIPEPVTISKFVEVFSL